LARAAWTKLLNAHAGIGVKVLRSMDPASCAWLYRNDRPWLTDHTPAKAREMSMLRHGAVRWDEKDRSLSVEVENAVQRLAGADVKLQLWAGSRRPTRRRCAPQARFGLFRRTHPRAPLDFRRVIHRLDSANIVTTCVVLLAKPGNAPSRSRIGA
jgi:hypothetical protein